MGGKKRIAAARTETSDEDVPVRAAVIFMLCGLCGNQVPLFLNKVGTFLSRVPAFFVRVGVGICGRGR